tara:strand:+ start:2528 stop:3331 length:804 start_codon:yes stop_codon:yes gene_type:complete
MFLDLEPETWNEHIYDTKIQINDYMNLHPYLFKQKYGCSKPDQRIINWENKVYLLLDYNKRSKKWRVFQCPEFTTGQIPSVVDINSWIYLPEENILTQVEPLIVNHPVSRWWLIEDLVKNENASVNEYAIKLKQTESWDSREAIWKIPSMKNGRSKIDPHIYVFQDSSIIGEAEVELVPVGAVFCVNAEKFLKQYAPGFLIKIKSGEYYYKEGGNTTFNNEKYTDVETYQEDGFEYYYTDIRNFNLKFKLTDNTDPHCIFLHDLEFQ